jgi:thiamine transporter
MLQNKRVLVLAEIAVLTALGIGLDYLANITQGSIFPYGGSISIAMVPIMVISFRRGVVAGVTTGLLVGMIQLIYGGHILQFFQMILDYPIPYAVVGFAGVFAATSKKLNQYTIIIGGIFAGLLRYFSHFLAGVTFWRAYVPTEPFLGLEGFNSFTWSIFYNGLYMIPSIIISVALVLALFRYANHLFVTEVPGSPFEIED